MDAFVYCSALFTLTAFIMLEVTGRAFYFYLLVDFVDFNNI